MTALDVIYAILELLAGIGVFLFGMKLMGDSLEHVAGNKIKDIFSKISDRKLIGVGIGATSTAVIQSSAAVTVMVIGFVNSGLMNLTQATAIVYGANIGTTVTAQIVALGYGGLKNLNLMVIFSALAGVGAFLTMFAKKENVRKVGGIITGLGMVFVGLSVMENSMTLFKESAEVTSLLAKLQSPMLLLIFGIFFTALIQSSSAVSGIVITMTAVGILDFSQGMYIIVGSNIGTCITSMLAAIGTSVNARRVAVVHLIFNVIGVVLFMITSIFVPYAAIFKVFGNMQTQIAMLHTFFNIVTVIILFPFTSLLVKLVCKIVKDKPQSEETEKESKPHFYFLDEKQLRTPPLAVDQLKKEILHMAALSKANFDYGLEAVTRGDLTMKETMQRHERQLNFSNKEIAKFLVKLSACDVTEAQRVYLGSCYHAITDFERIGDYAENLFEYAETLVKDGLALTEDAVKEVEKLSDKISDLFAAMISTYREGTTKYLGKVEEYEEEVDDLKAEMERKHIERLDAGQCSPEVGAIYLNLSVNAERVADHMTNVALLVKNYIPTK